MIAARPPTGPNFPQVVGPYRFLEALGSGAFASVYRGERTDRPGFLALKVLNPQIVRSSPEHVLALQDEAHLLQAIDSPFVVRFVAHDELAGPDGGLWHVLALEYVQGVTLGDLSELLTAMPGTVPLSAVVRLVDDILAGLAVAHAARLRGSPLGVVHRDLKPANVMVDEAGTARILDFGIAWALDRRALTEAGITKGTPPYMSSEQIRGGKLDGRSDLYVVGVMLFELLAGAKWVEPRGPDRQDAAVLMDCLFARLEPRLDELWAGMERRFAMDGVAAASLVSLLKVLLQIEARNRPPKAAVAQAMLNAPRDAEASRKLLGRLARGIRVAREGELRSRDIDATIVSIDDVR